MFNDENYMTDFQEWTVLSIEFSETMCANWTMDELAYAVAIQEAAIRDGADIDHED